MSASNQTCKVTVQACIMLCDIFPAIILWPSPCVLCYHLLMLVDFPGIGSVVANILQQSTRSSGFTEPHGNNSPSVSSKMDPEHFGIRAYCTRSSAVIITTTCPIHSLSVWLINDVTSMDWDEAWAWHFNRIKTMAPKTPQSLTKHLL